MLAVGGLVISTGLLKYSLLPIVLLLSLGCKCSHDMRIVRLQIL